MIKIGLDWCLRHKPKKQEYVTEIERIRSRMNELDEQDFEKNPEVEKEYNELKQKLSKLQVCPEETVGMRLIKDLSKDEQKKAFETYAVPRIKDAKAGKGHEGFINHWKKMTFEKWMKDYAESYLEEEIPEAMKDLPRVFGPFQAMAGWMSFRGKCVGYSDLINEELKNDAYSDMDPEQMIEYANHLEVFTKQWEERHSEVISSLEKYRDKLNNWNKDNDWLVTIRMNDEQKKEHKKKMKEKYGNEFIGFQEVLRESSFYDYDNLIGAISWLRFWAEKGHGMWAWY